MRLSVALATEMGVPEAGLPTLRAMLCVPAPVTTPTDPPEDFGLRVARVSLNDKMDYTDKTALPGGRTLEWKYIEFIPKSGSYVMYGRAKLNGGAVELGMAPSKDAPSDASVDKDFALETLKVIAASARVEGKRTCIGNCGPGQLVGPDK